ncbi:MAG: cytochrome d ubiquinol oxidase subunit II [Thiohalorhabdus sp.]|uniref:cytochrome d ubiquinol oxidase subunit II n=1 Tax=Thiohalorhabdus sp. TaxID=3094134 RepID=UPI00397FDDC3
MFDYTTIQLIWWGLVAVLLIGFALTDGFDMGAGTLMPFLGKTDTERRVVTNVLGPHWDGNQVWFILAGGALFAAWPMVYAAAFSGLYIPLLLVLFALILRPGAFEYRSKVDDTRWRSSWDWLLFVGSALPALLFGVAMGNLFLGLPFYLDEDLRPFYEGGFFELLHPFALLAGITSLSLLAMHGGTYLQMRTEGALRRRAVGASRLMAGVMLVAFGAAGAWLAAGMEGFRILQMPEVTDTIQPLQKSVASVEGAWLDNYERAPLTMLAPLAGFLGAVGVLLFSGAGRGIAAFGASTLAVLGVLLTAGVSLFPFIMPSSIDPVSSLTIWDATSSHRTLSVMLIATLIFMPIILLYTFWAFRAMRGRVTEEQVEENSHAMY